MVSVKFLLIILPSVVAHLNVFISQPEVMKLLGESRERRSTRYYVCKSNFINGMLLSVKSGQPGGSYDKFNEF